MTLQSGQKKKTTAKKLKTKLPGFKKANTWKSTDDDGKHLGTNFWTILR